MIAVLTAAQMRAADAAACERAGEIALMQTAGERIAQIVQRYARGTRMVAFAGAGNNGGDAFSALAALPAAYERVVYAREPVRRSAARRDAEDRAREAGVVVRAFPQTDDDARQAARDAAVLLDALFGIGARLPLPAGDEPAVRAMNASHALVLAVDIPSGVDADTGTMAETCVRADVTVALGALKPGLLLTPARSCVGDLWLADIGIDAEVARVQPPTFAALEDDAFLDLLPRRRASSDKRQSGAPLLIAGSHQFPGAAVLTALGAARAGAGYVTVVTPERAAAAVRMHLIEQVVVTVDEALSPAQAIDDLLGVAKRCSSVGIGPGLGLDDRTGEIIRGFAQAVELPIVADASALFHFAKHLDVLRAKRAIVTPHEKEFARLSGKGTIRQGERVPRVREFVDRTGVPVLLKGESTLIDDGRTIHINTTGTSALGTAGTGDVLTGMIATLLAQGLSPVDAARAGAYWHGLAGKHAARQRPVGVIARDIPDALAAALPHRTRERALRRIF